MKFIVEQIALYVDNISLTKSVLDDLSKNLLWVDDNVTCSTVFQPEINKRKSEINFENKLSFNHSFFPNGLEFELLSLAGTVRKGAGHFAMHCTEEELKKWKEQLKDYAILQEVWTKKHENPAVNRNGYHYCIFDTRHWLAGFCIKLIVRL